MDQPPFPGPPPHHPAPLTPVRRPWLVPPPPGLPYHRLACTPVNRWWRPLLGTLLVAGGFVLIGGFVVVAGMIVAIFSGLPVDPAGASFLGDPLLTLTVLLLSIALVLPIVYGAAALVQRRPPGTLSSVAGRLRWRWLGLCLLVAVAAGVLGQLALGIALSVTGEDGGELLGWVGWETFGPALVITLVLVPFQAAAEEYIFRGWLLQAFGAYLRSPWPGILLGAAGFTALHAYTDWGIVDVFTFGALMGWISVRTGGLEAAIALHTVNNVVAFLVSTATGELENTLRQGSVPWQSLVGTAVQLATFTVTVLFFARKRAIQTVSR